MWREDFFFLFFLFFLERCSLKKFRKSLLFLVRKVNNYFVDHFYLWIYGYSRWLFKGLFRSGCTKIRRRRNDRFVKYFWVNCILARFLENIYFWKWENGVHFILYFTGWKGLEDRYGGRVSTLQPSHLSIDFEHRGCVAEHVVPECTLENIRLTYFIQWTTNLIQFISFISKLFDYDQFSKCFSLINRIEFQEKLFSS